MSTKLSATTILGAFLSLISVAACTSNASSASDTSDIVAPGGACRSGTSAPFPQFRLMDESYFVAPAATKTATFEQTMLRLDLGQRVEHAFTLVALGGGAVSTNTQSIVTSDYAFCGNTLTLRRNAHVEFWGMADANALEATYCVPGTMDQEQETPRCELKAGIPLEARVFPDEGGKCDDGFGFGLGDPGVQVAGSPSTPHTAAGEKLESSIALDSDIHNVTIKATRGADAFELVASSWEACGSTITVKANARIGVDGKSPAAVAANCKPDTFAQGSDEPRSCELLDGATLQAAVFEHAPFGTAKP